MKNLNIARVLMINDVIDFYEEWEKNKKKTKEIHICFKTWIIENILQRQNSTDNFLTVQRRPTHLLSSKISWTFIKKKF